VRRTRCSFIATPKYNAIDPRNFLLRPNTPPALRVAALRDRTRALETDVSGFGDPPQFPASIRISASTARSVGRSTGPGGRPFIASTYARTSAYSSLL